MESREHVFVWKIKNFKCCVEKKGEKISSPVFVAESFDHSCWLVKFCPRGSNASDEGFISCFLQRDINDCGPLEIKCEFKIDMIGEYGNILFSNKMTGIFKKGQMLGWHNIEERGIFMKECERLCVDTLTIKCHLFSNLPMVKQCSKNVAVTKIGVYNCSFTYEIKNVTTPNSLRLIQFPCLGTSQVEVRIEIPEDDVIICVRRVDGFTDSQCVICKVDLLDVKGDVGFSISATHLFRYNQDSSSWQFPAFLKKSNLEAEKDKFLVENRFTLTFEISVSNGSKSETVENVPCAQVSDNSFGLGSRSDDTVLMLRNDLTRLFTENIQTDVNLKVQDEVFPAHRAILSARSPVFFAMFSHSMAESQTGDVEISDIRAETMKHFLKFMYTGETESLDCNLATELMMYAEKYQIVSLKEKCANFLKSILCVLNVCDILRIAVLFKHKILKASAVKFIKKNSGSIFSSNMWKEVIKKDLSLASETVSEVSLLLASDSKKTKRSQPNENSKSKRSRT